MATGHRSQRTRQRQFLQQSQVTAIAALLVTAIAAGIAPPTPPPVRPGTDFGRQLHAPPEQEEFSFVIFGDRTTGPRSGIPILEEAVVMANRLDPAFVMTVGDMIQGYNQPDEWVEQMLEYREIMNRLNMNWYPVVGNHDVYERPHSDVGHTDLYKEHFGPLYYSFDYKWAHFICLFSDEKMRFSNPSVNQNMSPEQMKWLEEDLQATDAEQIYVFLHHPRWLYNGTNWPEVHELLADDGRVRAAFAGHIHTYRDDGVEDGIHYYTMAMTGGSQKELGDVASFHHINHVRVRPDRITMAVLEIGDVWGSDVVLGREVDDMQALQWGGFVNITGTLRPSIESESQSEVIVSIHNPASKAISVDAQVRLPDGWNADGGQVQQLQIEPGDTVDEHVTIHAPEVTSAIDPLPQVQVRTHYETASGRQHRANLTEIMQLDLQGLDRFAAADPEQNHALLLDGSSALRINDSDRMDELEAFTLECWVRSDTPQGERTALVTKTENSAFGIFLAESGEARPNGYVFLQGHGYLFARAKEPIDLSHWRHIALVYDGDILRLFIDGEVQAAATQSGRMAPNSMPLFIGADPNRYGEPVSFFAGLIDEVRLSNNARYDESFEPQRLLHADEHTIAMLHFDQPAIGTRDAPALIADESVHAHHGWPVGEPRLVPADARSQEQAIGNEAQNTIDSAPPYPAADGFNEAGSDARAIELAHETMHAMGGYDAWKDTRYITWQFFDVRQHVWDTWTNRVRVTTIPRAANENVVVAIIDLDTGQGSVWDNNVPVTDDDELARYVDSAIGHWINDSYWLVMPYKLKDSGVTLKHLGNGETEQGDAAELIELTFEGVGRTPQNKYHVWVADDSKLVRQWGYFADRNDEEPRFIMPWNDWKQYGRIMLSGDRGELRGMSMELEHIDVFDALPEAVFTGPEPLDLEDLQRMSAAEKE